MTRKEILAPFFEVLAVIDQQLTRSALVRHQWRIDEAAEELALDPEDFRCLMATYGIEVPKSVTDSDSTEIENAWRDAYMRIAVP
jgi:DNA-binding NtrC family response regulator